MSSLSLIFLSLQLKNVGGVVNGQRGEGSVVLSNVSAADGGGGCSTSRVDGCMSGWRPTGWGIEEAGGVLLRKGGEGLGCCTQKCNISRRRIVNSRGFVCVVLPLLFMVVMVVLLPMLASPNLVRSM